MLPPTNGTRTPPSKTKTLDDSRRKNYYLFKLLAFTLVIVVGFTCFALFVGFKSDNLRVKKDPPVRNPSLSEAKPHTNCTDFEGAILSVQQIAKGEGYLHVFEYDRLHPCCVNREEVANVNDIDLDDIVFLVMTSSQTRVKAKTLLDTWGRGVKNLLLISDIADPEVGSVSFDEISGGVVGGNSRPASSAPRSVSRIDKQHRQIWGMKYIYSDPQYASLLTKKWFFLADDDTWVNIPALLDLTSQYDHRCPVTFGYIWSHVWIEDFDYISGGAGLLMSQKAFLDLTPAFYTDSCPFAHYNDITFGRCAWTLKVQMVHHRGFYFDPPERSKDRHEVVWFPPVAEAITYHYVQPNEMAIMTNYANERWQWQPKIQNSSRLQARPEQQPQHTTQQSHPTHIFAEPNTGENVHATNQLNAEPHWLPLRSDWIQSVKSKYGKRETDDGVVEDHDNERLQQTKVLKDLARHDHDDDYESGNH